MARFAEGELFASVLSRECLMHSAYHSPEINKAVQCALVPRLKSSLENSASYGFTTLANNGLLLPTDTPYAHSMAGDAPIANYAVRPSVLDKIQEYLLLGEKRMAYRHALDERMWAHAMLIASSVDKDAWKEAVTEFVRTELGAGDGGPGRETLRVAYSMFSGQGYSSGETLFYLYVKGANHAHVS